MVCEPSTMKQRQTNGFDLSQVKKHRSFLYNADACYDANHSFQTKTKMASLHLHENLDF